MPDWDFLAQPAYLLVFGPTQDDQTKRLNFLPNLYWFIFSWFCMAPHTIENQQQKRKGQM